MRKKMVKYAFLATLLLVVVGAVTFVVLNDPVYGKFNKAMELRDQGRHEEAANLFGEIALVYPQTKYADDALFEQGFTYFIKMAPHVEEMQKAVYEKLAANSFESLIEKYPDSTLIKDSLVYLAKINTDLGQLGESIHYYDQAADRIEDPVEKQKIYFNMVRNLEMMQQNQQAVDKLKQIIDIGVHSVYLENAYLTLAGYYRIIARERPIDTEDAYGAMIVLLQDMLAVEEVGTASRRDALMLLAEAYFELDSYDRCEEALAMIENLETADESFTLNETDVLAIEGYRKRIEMHSRMGR